MGICPYCKQHIGLKDLKSENIGVGFIQKEKMYVCPFCDYILGFSYAMR